jgi:hypothetical protein
VESVPGSPPSRSLVSGMVGPLVGAIFFAILVGLLAAAGRSWAAPVMAAAVLALCGYYIRALGIEVGLVALLIVTSVVDHFTFSVGSLALRAEQVAALVALIFLGQMRLRAGDAAWLKPTLAEILLLAWFVIGIVSSLLSSPDRRLSAKILALIAICSLGLLLPRRLLAGARSAEQMEKVTRLLLLIFATEAAYGTVAYLIHVFGPTIGLTPNPASGHLSAYGTLWEQNVFGAFVAAGAVAWVYLGPSRFKWAAVGLGACVGGLFDSLTRAAWLAAGLAALLGLGMTSLRRRIDFRVVGLGGLIGVGVVAATLVVDRVGRFNVQVSRGTGGGGASGFLTAILNMVDVAGRANQIGPVLNDLGGHFVLGGGIAGYEARHVIQGIPQHLASLPLLVLNDTGLVGLLVFGAFVVAVIVRVWSVRSNALVVGLGQAAIVIGLTNLSTETTELMIGWLLIGLLLAACDVASTIPVQPAVVDSGTRPI